MSPSANRMTYFKSFDYKERVFQISRLFLGKNGLLYIGRVLGHRMNEDSSQFSLKMASVHNSGQTAPTNSVLLLQTNLRGFCSRQHNILENLESRQADDGTHEKEGNLLETTDENLVRDEPILQMRIGAFDRRPYFVA